MVIKEFSDEELRRIPPVEVGYRHWENPFKTEVLADVPGAFELSRRWAMIHWPEDFAEVEQEAEVDPFTALRSALNTQNLCHEARNEQGEIVGVHPLGVNPNDKLAVAEWEQRCQAMHQNQRPVELAPKPFTNHLERGLTRGD